MAKILIVEDDLDLVETYTDLLEAHGHSITAVPRASEAIKIITQHKPAIIILDLNLPGEPGGLVINFIRGYKPVANTKIIVATGHPEMMSGANFIVSKVDAVLTKPVSNRQLLALIDECTDPQIA
jgi:CheY-like chemotaxis protein